MIEEWKRGLVLVAVLLHLGCSKPVPLPVAKDVIILESIDFKNQQPIPVKFSASGGNISPELHWSAPPTGTKSLVLVVQDPDAPGASPFTHWLLYNIPPSVTQCQEGSVPTGALVGKNDAGTAGYFGPKPPSGTHHYVFHLYALDSVLQLPNGSSLAQVANVMAGHELGMGELTGLYSAP